MTPKHYSISQLNKYQECPRKHYYQHVLGYESPSTSAQDYGKKCHEYFESYLKGEIDEFPKDWQGKTCQAAKAYLPLPKSGEVEKSFEMHLPELTVPIIGFMDYCSIMPENRSAVLLDHKIVSSDQYLLTPEKLAQTNQIITYSKYLIDQSSQVDEVEASYLYIKRGGGFVKKVTVHLERDAIESSFTQVAQGFKQLQNNFTKETLDEVPQILSACEKWGGCPFKDKCWGTQKGFDMHSLFDKLSSLTAKPIASVIPTTDTPAPAPAPTPTPSESVVSNVATQETSAPSIATQETSAPSVESQIAIDSISDLLSSGYVENSKPLSETQSTLLEEMTEDLAVEEKPSAKSEETDDAEEAEDVVVEEIIEQNVQDVSEQSVFQLAAASTMTIHVLTPSSSNLLPKLDLSSITDTINAPEYAQVQAATLLALQNKVATIDVAAVAEIRNEVLNGIVEEDDTSATFTPISTPTSTPTLSSVSSLASMLATSGTIAQSAFGVVSTSQQTNTSPIGVVASSLTTSTIKQTSSTPSWLDIPVDNIARLANRTKNSLTRQNFETLRDVFSTYPNIETWTSIKGFGKNCLDDVKEFLREKGLLETQSQPIQTSLLDNIETPKVVATETVVETPKVVATETIIEAPKVVVTETIIEAPKVVATETIVETPKSVATETIAKTPIVSAISTPIENKATQTPSTQSASKQETQKSENVAFNGVLLLGTIPVKGLDYVYFEDLIEPFENEIARANDTPHISLVNFSKGYDQLAASVKHLIATKGFDWSKAIYVSAQAQNTYAKAVSVLVQNAKFVFKNS